MAAGGGGHRRAAVGRSFSNLRLSVEAFPGSNLRTVKISGHAEDEGEDQDAARNALSMVAGALADQPPSRGTQERKIQSASQSGRNVIVSGLRRRDREKVRDGLV